MTLSIPRLSCIIGTFDTQPNDTQPNDTQPNDTQHNDTQHNYKKMPLDTRCKCCYAECSVSHILLLC